MKVRDRYDWIVLGTHPGALVSASLAARLGLSVLILPFGLPLASRRTGKGQVFDPESNLILGISEDGLNPGLVLQCLGLGDVASEFLMPCRGQGRVRPQVLTPRARLVLESNELLPFEIQRELGASASTQLGLDQALKNYEADLLAFWSQLPKDLILREPISIESKSKRYTYSLHRSLEEMRKKLLAGTRHAGWLSDRESVGQLAERIGVGDFTQIARGLYAGLASTPVEDPHLFDLLLLLNVSRTSASFRGGMSAYREFLIQRALELGVHYSPQAECKRIFIEQNQFLGVQIAGAGNMILGDRGILGCSFSRVDSTLIERSSGWRLPWQQKKIPRPEPIGWRFTLTLSVHREAIPEPMQSRAFWQEGGAPPLEIEVLEASDYGKADAENQTLFLRTVLPFELETLDRDYQRRIAGRMFRQATELLPFLEYHVTEIYPDFRGNSQAVQALLRSQPQHSVPTLDHHSPVDLNDELTRLYGFPSLEAIPDPLLCYSGQGRGPITEVEKLYSASDESYPFLGSLGGVIAAIQAVSEATRRSSIRRD